MFQGMEAPIDRGGGETFVVLVVNKPINVTK
jgi:hypothetical protein